MDTPDYARNNDWLNILKVPPSMSPSVKLISTVAFISWFAFASVASTCQLYFPQVVGTKFEREPFAGQQNGLGSKTSEKGLWGVGGH